MEVFQEKHYNSAGEGERSARYVFDKCGFPHMTTHTAPIKTAINAGVLPFAAPCTAQKPFYSTLNRTATTPALPAFVAARGRLRPPRFILLFFRPRFYAGLQLVYLSSNRLNKLKWSAEGISLPPFHLEGDTGRYRALQG